MKTDCYGAIIYTVIVMKYINIRKGTFLSRPNRFIARVEIEGNTETVHVKNTGRCREILVEGAVVYLEESKNPERKTKYDLIAVEKKTENGTILINTDSQIPNAAVYEFLQGGGIFPENTLLKREVTYGNSRFDLFAKNDTLEAFIEVKGVTLEKNGTALFPDAPTLRGVKHINELISVKREGKEAYIIFVIQMSGIKEFTPNREMHPEFADALLLAKKSGVKILAYQCDITPDSIEITEPVPVRLT